MRRRNPASLENVARSRRWRTLYWVGVTVVVGALVAGLAFASLTTSGTGSGFASTGGVSLSVNAPATTTCNYTNLVPGDLTGPPKTCALSVTYTGSLSGFVSLTVKIQSTAGSGGQRLYDGSNTAGLTFTISDGTNSFTVPTAAGTSPGITSCGSGCWQANNDLAAWYPGPNLTFTNGKTATWTVTPDFPSTVNNPYQGGTATMTLTAQAVQSAANALPGSCTTSTIGTPCPAGGGFAWS